MDVGKKAKEVIFHPAAPYVVLGVMALFVGYGCYKNRVYKEFYGCGCGR